MSENNKNCICSQTTINNYAQWLFYIILLIVTLYFFTTRFWEPGGETWASWAFARMLRETGGIPTFSGSPLYVLYLQIFSPFQFPLNFKIEYWITHFFCALAIFVMLSRFIPRYCAILLTIAWIPFLGRLEGTDTVAAIGFVAIYFIIENSSYRQSEYFSSALWAAALCNPALIFFPIAHGIGEVIRRLINKTPLFLFEGIDGHHLFFYYGVNRLKKIPWIKIFLIMLIVLTVLFPSQRLENLEWVDQKYTPYPLSETTVLDGGFFAQGFNYYVSQTYPESDWSDQDWYFTQKDTFGDSKNLIQALITKPQFSGSLIFLNLQQFPHLWKFLVFGLYFDFSNADLKIVLYIFSGIILVLGFVGLISTKESEKIPLITMVCLGGLGVFFIYLFSGFGGRHDAYILPIGLLLLVNSQKGVEIVINYFQCKKNSCRLTDPTFSNMIELSYIKNKKFIFHIAIVILSIIIIFYPLHLSKENLSSNHLLNGQKPISYINNSEKFLGSINSQSKLLTLSEDNFAKAFSSIGLDNVVSIFSIPPFKDKTNQTNDLLNTFDVIWVNKYYSSPHGLTCTNPYIRYRENIQPYLDTGIKSGEWTKQEIVDYGQIYYHVNKSYSLENITKKR